MEKKLLIVLFLLLAAKSNSQTFNSGAINTSIPNNGVGVTAIINTSGLPSSMDASFGLESLCMDIEHTSTNNLEAYLIAPNGIQVQLSTQNGANGDNYTGTCFSMLSANSVINGTAPFTGAYRPQGNFGAINNGTNPNGIWKLILVDVIPAGADSGKIISWNIKFSNSPAQPLTLSSNLPLLVINTNGQWIEDAKKKTVDFDIIYNGPGSRNDYKDSPSYRGKIGIEIRGSTSQMYPKKSYEFETRNESGDKEQDTSLMGMPTEHAWVLHAPYSDKSLIRNVLTYELFAKMGHYSPRTKLVELVLNGQYQGVYVLVEKIRRDKKRVNVSKLSKTDIAGDALTGGYIIRIDRLKRVGPSPGWESAIPSQAETKIYYQYQYPSEDSIMPQQMTYIKNYVDSFETALNDGNFDLAEGYRKFIGLTSFVDFFLINELSKNIDGYRLSTFLHKDKKSKSGGKLQIGPVWDFDIAWGNANANGGNVSGDWQFKMLNDQYPIPFWWKKFDEDPAFRNDVSCRFDQLKLTVLSTVNINRIIDSTTALLSEAQVRNFNQWPVMSKDVYINPQPMPGTYNGEVKNVKDWVKNRLTWMDAHIAAPSGVCNILAVNEILTSDDFAVFPNPFGNLFVVNYKLKSPSKIYFEIFNAIGMKVNSSFQYHSSAGNFSLEFNLKNLPAGIYFLKATAGEMMFSQKIIKTQ